MKTSNYLPALDFPSLPGVRLITGIPHRLPALGPLLGGVLSAFVTLRALSWLPADEQVRGLAALAGISAWLYIGQALRGYSLAQMATDVVTAALILVLASQVRSTPALSLSAAFVVQALWTIGQLGRKSRERDHRQLLFAWLSFNLILAVSGWFLFA